jgi:hypothetical protein
LEGVARGASSADPELGACEGGRLGVDDGIFDGGRLELVAGIFDGGRLDERLAMVDDDRGGSGGGMGRRPLSTFSGSVFCCVADGASLSVFFL